MLLTIESNNHWNITWIVCIQHKYCFLHRWCCCSCHHRSRCCSDIITFVNITRASSRTIFLSLRVRIKSQSQKWWQWCWWHLYVGDFMIVSDLRCWWQNHYVGPTIWRLFSIFWWFPQCIKSVTNILNPSPTTQTCHQNICSPTCAVTNIDVTSIIIRSHLAWTILDLEFELCDTYGFTAAIVTTWIDTTSQWTSIDIKTFVPIFILSNILEIKMSAVLNPYYQKSPIMENSSRTFSEIFIFWVMGQTHSIYFEISILGL